jgi:DNA topoisomerase-3
MRLVIAEKPSVAKAIKEAMPGQFEVTNCFGHLFELANPEEYSPDLKQWSLNSLPIRVSNWKLKVKPTTADQFKKIRDLLSRATEVIHAGDPDREGQLLVDEVLEQAGWKGPTKRVLLSAVDPKSIQKAFSKLEDNAKYRPLMLAAQSRQRADWLVGINMTRAVTKALADGPTVSIGRVQTPTLALVVNRQRAIENFVPETFYTLVGQIRFGTGADDVLTMKAEPEPRIGRKEVAQALAKATIGKGGPLSVERTAKTRLAPMPFDLPSFQKAAEQFFGWGVAKALEVLQKTYEAKLVTYPRSDCRYLPREQAAEAVGIAKAVAAKLPTEVDAKILEALEPSPRIYNTAKVAEHHGIIPTGLLPSGDVSDDVLKAWRLVSVQFIASLLPNLEVEETKVSLTVPVNGRVIKDVLFKASGEIRLSSGVTWSDFKLAPALGLKPKPSNKEPAQPLPRSLENGREASVESCDIAEGVTRPPEPFTEASLVAEMSSVAKYVTDEKLKAVLKEGGIGTAATQADIIEKLKKRGFIGSRKAKTKEILFATELGCEVIDAIPPALADPIHTAIWETQLADIAKGQAKPEDFMASIERAVGAWLGEILTLQRTPGAKRIRAAAPATKWKSNKDGAATKSKKPATRRGRSKAKAA